MLCPKCGRDNNPFAKYCEDCGEELPEVQMETSDEQFIDEEQELKISEAAPVAEAVRPTEHLGNMPLESFDDQEAFEPQMLTFNTQGYHASQATLGYVKPNDVPILTSPKQVDSDGFVPGAAFSNLKETKKKKSKLRVTFLIISILIILSIVTFFGVQYLIYMISTQFMREHTSEFVFNAYTLSAKQFIESEELLRMFSPENKSGTAKASVTVNGKTTSQVCSFDMKNKRFYCSVEKDAAGMELYANTEKCFLQYNDTAGSSYYFIPLENLRNDAVSSFAGPQGGNAYKLTQEQYDCFMDLYEYLYHYITAYSDDKEQTSKLKELFETICSDIDKNSEIEIKDEQVSVEGSEKVSVYLIVRTIKGKQVFQDIYRDITGWINEQAFLNGDVQASLLSLAEKINPDGGELMKDLSSFEMQIQNFVNKSDSSLVQTIINATINDEKSETRIFFGIDPSATEKIVISTNALKSSAPADPNQSSSAEANKNEFSVIEISRQKETLQSTYTFMMTTPDNEAKYVMTRDNSTGKYTLETTRKASATAEPVTTKTNGVLKCDSVSISLSTEQTQGKNKIKMEYSYESHSEMNELSSNNDMLKHSLKDVSALFPKLDKLLADSFFSPLQALIPSL